MQLEKHMVEVESSLFCLDPGRQMMSMLRRWEIGATLILVRIHCISLSGKGRGLRAVSLGICDYCISTGKQPLEVACITRCNDILILIFMFHASYHKIFNIKRNLP